MKHDQGILISEPLMPDGEIPEQGPGGVGNVPKARHLAGIGLQPNPSLSAICCLSRHFTDFAHLTI